MGFHGDLVPNAAGGADHLAGWGVPAVDSLVCGPFHLAEARVREHRSRRAGLMAAASESDDTHEGKDGQAQRGRLS